MGCCRRSVKWHKRHVFILNISMQCQEQYLMIVKIFKYYQVFPARIGSRKCLCNVNVVFLIVNLEDIRLLLLFLYYHLVYWPGGLRWSRCTNGCEAKRLFQIKLNFLITWKEKLFTIMVDIDCNWIFKIVFLDKDDFVVVEFRMWLFGELWLYLFCLFSSRKSGTQRFCRFTKHAR